MSAGASETKPPEVPGVWRLMWLLFMQPIKLHHMFKAWGLEGDPSLWKLRRRLLDGDETVRRLVGRFLVILVVGPTIAFATSCGLSLVMQMNWTGVAIGLAAGVAVGVTIGVASDLLFGAAGGVALSIAGGVVGGVALGMKGGFPGNVMGGVAVGVALGVVLGVGEAVDKGVTEGMEKGMEKGVTLGVVFTFIGGPVFGVAGGVAIGVAVFVFLYRVPFFWIGSIATGVMSFFEPGATTARWLPHRHHDLIYFPLPGLHRLLTNIGLRDPLLARQLIDEATATIAQGKPAQRALRELQAHVLDKAARDGQWSIVANLQSPFFPLASDLRPEESLATFVDAAKDVIAADTGGSQHRRRNLLESARRRIESLKLGLATGSASSANAANALLEAVPVTNDTTRALEESALAELVRVADDSEIATELAVRAGYPRESLPAFASPETFWSKTSKRARDGVIRGGVSSLIDAAAERYPHNAAFAKYRELKTKASSRSPTPGSTDRQHAPRLLSVAQQWSEAITAKLDALQRAIAESPEIPAVYVPGPPLDPTNKDEVALFRVRRDLVAIIDRDLDDDRRGPLFLTGQRRMGKTSLLRMLPAHLGAATIISINDFQQLSGSPLRHAPHRLIVQRLAEDLRRIPSIVLPSPDTVTDAWGTALDWLRDVDAALARTHHRVLVTIDEIEGLQVGANAGWTDLTFLDFVRAAGDPLRRIRLLLVSAHQLTSPRLGPNWPGRLISAYSCHLGPLPREDADPLLRKPVDYFPDTVFDDAAVAAVLAQTGGHPYLIQLVGNEVVKRLNGSTPRRTTATPHDIDRALDDTTTLAGGLFSDLWGQDFDDTDRTLLRALAHNQPVDTNTPSFRSLRDQFFVELRADGTPAFVFPLFARWIRDYQS